MIKLDIKYHGAFFPLINLAGKTVRNLNQYPYPYEPNGYHLLLPYLSMVFVEPLS